MPYPVTVHCLPTHRYRDAGPSIIRFRYGLSPQAEYEDTGARRLRNIEGDTLRTIQWPDYLSWAITLRPPI